MKFSTRDSHLATLGQLGPFRHCSPVELHRIGRLATPVRFAADDTLSDEVVAGYFYVVVRGHLAILEDGCIGMIAGPGDHFGEDKLFGGCHVPMSVVALSDGEMLVMSRRELLTILRSVPEVAIFLLEETLGRKSASSGSS